LLATVGIIVVFALYGYRISQLNDDSVFLNVNKSLSSLGLTVILFLIGSLITIGYGIYRICLSQKMKVHSVRTKKDIMMILPVILSTLVSVNITLALYMFQNSRSKSTANNSCFSSIGVAMGLFTACPTCAGTFFSTITGIITAGTSSALATAGATSAIAPF